MDIFGDFWGLIEGELEWSKRSRVISDQVAASSNDTQLDALWSTLTPEEQKNGWVLQTFRAARGKTAADVKVSDPLKEVIGSLLDDWVKTVQKYDMKDPAKASETLTALTADVMKISAGALAIELVLGLGPNNQGPIAKATMSELMGWLGFGAVVTAVAHDPVKIGLLRPYQDTLEATFRNRRPGDIALFQAYRTRELSPVKIEDLSKLTDAEMDRIEKDNDEYYTREIAKWGYSEWFATALSRSATVTLNFAQLNSLARQGLLSRGLAIYSLWGQGLDRVVMKPALDALMAQNQMASYEGFRSMVEPAYVEGDIPEADLLAYWDRIAVPKDVQGWILPRMKKRREKYQAKEKEIKIEDERDLTSSQITAAYRDSLIDRAKAQNWILELGYGMEETNILLDLADLRRKTPSAEKLKRLTLTDYEKAYKNELISLDAVLDRMKGEYAPGDIALEKLLLEIGKA